jgi:hypothetical protein
VLSPEEVAQHEQWAQEADQKLADFHPGQAFTRLDRIAQLDEKLREQLARFTEQQSPGEQQLEPVADVPPDAQQAVASAPESKSTSASEPEPESPETRQQRRSAIKARYGLPRRAYPDDE